MLHIAAPAKVLSTKENLIRTNFCKFLLSKEDCVTNLLNRFIIHPLIHKWKNGYINEVQPRYNRKTL